MFSGRWTVLATRPNTIVMRSAISATAEGLTSSAGFAAAGPGHGTVAGQVLEERERHLGAAGVMDAQNSAVILSSALWVLVMMCSRWGGVGQEKLSRPVDEDLLGVPRWCHSSSPFQVSEPPTNPERSTSEYWPRLADTTTEIDED